jgi:ribosomal protein L40E
MFSVFFFKTKCISKQLKTKKQFQEAMFSVICFQDKCISKQLKTKKQFRLYDISKSFFKPETKTHPEKNRIAAAFHKKKNRGVLSTRCFNEKNNNNGK